MSKEEAKHEYGFTPIDEPQSGHYDAIVLAVAHNEFTQLGSEVIHAFGKSNHVLFDIKYVLESDQVDGRL